jgi:hypothetical protein
MASSRALTVRQYLAELPPERRAVVSAVRDLVNANLPPGYVETMNWGMICWEVPLSRCPETYNGHPLAYMALAAQKGNFALYSIGAYAGPELVARLREEFAKAGARLDMGKSCIRFASLDGMPAGAVKLLASFATVEQFIALHERGRHGRTKPATKPAPRKTARVAAAAKTAPRAKAKPAARPKRAAAGRPAAKAKAAKKRR